ncbi:tRNA (adenosine(37)-N6)-dimethylallyltransferase MiaA, partial [Candidatus Bipolaricaulota bacterium]|nr:tRNA (adenosine(37)-N6)-dimethylallyltransferase MiaA [Candidatus Bipolaricaulota bacterium]
QEVEALVDEGFGPEWGAWETIGYKELALFLREKIEFEEAVERIKKNTRHLAKYQQNWMKKVEGIEMLDLEGEIKPVKFLVELLS